MILFSFRHLESIHTGYGFFNWVIVVGKFWNIQIELNFFSIDRYSGRKGNKIQKPSSWRKSTCLEDYLAFTTYRAITQSKEKTNPWWNIYICIDGVKSPMKRSKIKYKPMFRKSLKYMDYVLFVYDNCLVWLPWSVTGSVFFYNFSKSLLKIF